MPPAALAVPPSSGDRAVPRRRWMAAAVVVALTAGCGNGSGRYRMQVDPASRYAFRHVQDRQTGRWVHREVEVRVSERRRLPDPISTSETGDLLHTTRFEPGSAGTGDLVPGRFERRDGHRLWRYRQVASEADLLGRSAVGIQVEWPKEGRPSDWEPMEIFGFPPFGETPPEVWSSWTTAEATREGMFAWWEETHGRETPPPAPIAHPFELRWRLLLSDDLFVP